MSAPDDPQEPFEPAAMTDAMIARLRPAMPDARALLRRLCSVRAFAEVERLAEAIRRRDPKDVVTRRIYGQAMIENGRATAAIDLLQVLRDDLPEGDPERAQAVGLIGRAFKEIYFDAADGDRTLAGKALNRAIIAYRETFRHDPAANTWQGLSLLGLALKARQGGHSPTEPIEVEPLARELLAQLDRDQAKDGAGAGDPWRPATQAMALLALDDWPAAQAKFGEFLNHPDTDAFQIGGTVRELLRTWGVEEREGGKALVAALNAKLAAREDGAAEMSADAVRAEQARLQNAGKAGDKKDVACFEAVLGDAGAKTYKWWKNGMDRAQAVASVRDSVAGSRFGTGFLTTADAFGLGGADEQVVVTNFHVVNRDGEFTDERGRQRALKPDEATVVFEAVDTTEHAVAEILWSSPNDRHDVSILRLREKVGTVTPLGFSTTLPLKGDDPVPRVYVIGYPGGRDLAFSFQDNELLDHEGPTEGKPQIEGVCRVHYRAPTEGGSSGSPVFNSDGWKVVAVHHRGGRSGMPKLNGVEGLYGANEAISIASIAEAIAKERAAAKPA